MAASLLVPGLLLFSSVQKALAAQGTLLLNNFTVPAGALGSVPVTVNVTGGDLTSYSVTITYDESVVDVLNDANIILNPAFTGSVVADAGAGTSTITASTNTPMVGTFKLADIRFTGMGASGATSNVTITPENGSFMDSSAAPFSPEPASITATATLVDQTPDTFSLPNQVNVALNTPIDSAPVTITGIDPATPISVTGGQYSIDSGEFTSAAGTINSGQTVVVRLMSSPDYGTATTAFLKVGTGGDDFKVTTLTFGDQTPDAFAFVNQNNVPLSTAIVSAPVTITGIDVPTAISISAGGEYSIDNGEFTSVAGTINNGQSVSVRVTSSDQFATAVSTTLRVGTGGDDFRATTFAQDIVADQFNFVDKIDVPQNSEVISDPIIITGINSPTPISITGGMYSINGGPYTADPNSVSNNDQVTVKLTSSTELETATVATLTVGTISDEFSATTLAADTTPDPFTFDSILNAPTATTVTSNTITVAGIEAPASISITGGEYAIGSGDFTSAAGTVSNGDQVTVRQTSSDGFSTLTTAALTIGGVSSTFDVTTLADPADTVPDQFTFEDQLNVPVSTLVESTPITVNGIGSPATISVTGGEYAIGTGDFVSTEGTVSDGETVRVRHTSAATYLTPTDTVLTIGGVSDTFTSTTIVDPAADITPDQFTFADQTDVALDTPIESAAITIAGIDAPSPISVTGGEYAVNDGAFTSVAGNVSNGDSVRVRVTSASTFSTPASATLTVDGISDDFTVTTLAEDTTPDAFSLSAIADAPLSTVETSNTVTVSGINSLAPISVTNGEYSINGGDFTAADGTVKDGDEVVVRQTSSASFLTTTVSTLTIGGVGADFSVTTLAEPVNDAPVLQQIPDQNVKVNNALTFTAVATDPNGDTLSFSMADAPEGASIDPVTGVFAWTPKAAGTFTAVISVTDGALTDSQTVTFNVTDEEPPVVPPVVISPSAVEEQDKDNCGKTCEKYKDVKRKYKSTENRRTYDRLKIMKRNDLANFRRLESIYKTYRDLSDRELRKGLNPQLLSEFKLFEKYNGYKHYLSLKDRVDSH